MKCILPAVRISGAGLTDGVVMGLAMAAITRTRHSTKIYLLLLIATATMWPLYSGWPSAFSWDILEYTGPIGRVINYLEALRPLMYLLGVPFPYANYGQHEADPIPYRDSLEDDMKSHDDALQ
jgi:hypothetical protein